MHSLNQQGWNLFDSIVDDTLINRLNTDLKHAYTIARQIQIQNGVAENTSGTINHLLGLGDSFLEFLERLYLKEAIAQFFDGQYILNIFGGVSNLKDYSSYLLNIHRDVRTFTGDYKLMIQLLVMLDDFTTDNGATYLMNGGHRKTYGFDTLEKDAVEAGLTLLHRSGVFFKGLANFQFDQLMGTDIISDGYLEDCYQLGMQYPDLCASIYLVCEKGGS